MALLHHNFGGGVSVVSPLAAAHDAARDAAPYGAKALADVGGHGCCP